MRVHAQTRFLDVRASGHQLGIRERRRAGGIAHGDSGARQRAARQLPRAEDGRCCAARCESCGVFFFCFGLSLFVRGVFSCFRWLTGDASSSSSSRQDLGMHTGKIAAQVAHAAVGLFQQIQGSATCTPDVLCVWCIERALTFAPFRSRCRYSVDARRRTNNRAAVQ